MNNQPLGEKTITCIIGLGYVGWPLAKAFARKLKVIGYDTDPDRVEKLIKDSNNPNLLLTNNPKDISKADFIIISVPTPVTKEKKPDLSHIINAASTIGQNIKKGSVVILESTVYPGVTEELMKPVLEEASGFKCGIDFKVGYSPERINPGDEEHGIDKIIKVVSGMDEKTTELIAQLYSKVTSSIFKARDIKTAEAAKVIENIQRDLNIALMNELTLIFGRMDLDIRDVLAAAATKWNFARYSPGLVGGHCIPVDPYYLVHKAEELGYSPQVILAGRNINNSMPKYVAEIAVKALNNTGKVIKGSKVFIAGLSYKENVPDIRETPAVDIIQELQKYGLEITGYDPLVEDIEKYFDIQTVRDLNNSNGFDCIIVTVHHNVFKDIGLDGFRKITSNNPILIDVRGIFNRDEAKNQGFHYQTL